MKESEGFLGRARELLERTFKPNPEPKIPNGQLLTTLDKLPFRKPFYTIEDILDPKKEVQERQDLHGKLKKSKDDITKNPPKGSVPAEVQKIFRVSEQRVVEMTKFLHNTGEEYKDYENSSRELLYRSFVLRHNIVSLAAEIILHENIAKLLENVGKHLSQPLFVQNYYSLVDDIYATDLTVRAGGLTLVNFLDRNTATKVKPSQIYKFLAELSEARSQKRKPAQILEENRPQNSLTKYPNYFLHCIVNASAKAWALTNCFPEDLDSEIGNYGGNQEVTARARRIVEHSERIIQNIYKTILNPKSPDFPELMEALEHSLSEDKVNRIAALNLAGLQQVLHIPELYRQARLFAKQGVYPKFYSHLAEATREYAQEVPDSLGILTEDDLPELIDSKNGAQVFTNIPTWEDLSKIINQIISRTSAKEYNIGTQGIDCRPFISPESITLQFHPTFHKRFLIQFNYKSETGETQILGFGGDLKKGSVDWSFLEDFDENNTFSNLHKAFLCIARMVLSQALKQEQETTEQKFQEKPATIVKPSQKRERPSPDLAVPKRKEVLDEIRRQNANSVETSIPYEQLLDESVKRQVIVPTQETQKKLSSKLSAEDGQRIWAEIEGYNNNQLGKFEPLKRRGPNGEIFWSLHISGKSPVRVLAVETDPNGKSRRFEIIDIAYRKDVYRKWHIE